MADALDDEWWLEENKVEHGENETKGKKRQQKELAVDEKTDISDHEKKPRGNKKKRKKPKVESVTLTTEFNGRDDVRQVLWKTFCDCSSKSLSNLELEELEINESCCLSDDSVHTGALSEFPPYLNQVIPNWVKNVDKLDKKCVKGAPILLVVSSAATRAVELNRSATDFKGKCKTVKLFAKHMKMEEQEQFLESHIIHVGIGTPSRILKLLQHGSLKTSQLKYVILDWTWRDQKLRRMVDIPEVREELLSLLKEYLFPLARTTKLRIGLF